MCLFIIYRFLHFLIIIMPIVLGYQINSSGHKLNRTHSTSSNDQIVEKQEHKTVNDDFTEVSTIDTASVPFPSIDISTNNWEKISSVESTTTTATVTTKTILSTTTKPSIITETMVTSSSHLTNRTFISRNRNVTHHRHSNLTSTLKPTAAVKLPLKLAHKTDTPMLNYIFDTMSASNKHHHHNDRYGPHFEDIKTVGNVTNITVQIGSSVYLNCRISLLQDKTVSWVRRKHGEDELQLLTVGHHTYSGDSRYTIEFQYPSNWRLKITAARKIDEGTYECQISTHPPRVIQVNLHINAPEVMIIDEKGAPLQDKYYEVDSTIQLSCIVRFVAMSTSVVFWSHGERILNYDTTRGGISVKTDLMEEGANSTLFVARVNKSDSGNYSCSIGTAQFYTVTVHVLNGESYAELHHGCCGNPSLSLELMFLVWIVICSTLCRDER